MKQVCLLCGAEYVDHVAVCTASVLREVVEDSDFVVKSFPCGGRQWSYPAEEPVVEKVEEPAPKQESPVSEVKFASDRGNRK